jgi:CRP/FNR family transcriptional regulator, anaerobic regulatory protein
MPPVKSVPASRTAHSTQAAPSPLSTQVDRGVRVNCSTCRSGDHCIAGGLPLDDLKRIDQQGFFRRAVRRGEHLYRSGQRFTALYAVRTGFFKTTVLLEEGRSHVTGFHMAGDVIGTDGIGTGTQASEAVALEDSEVCVLPFERLEELTRVVPTLQHSLHRLLSREIVREQGVMALLGGMSADARVAAFLLNLSYRFEARHYSGLEFNLRMSREDIGSYLGLKLETVSRTLSRFAEEGLLSVQNKLVRILDLERMHRLAGQAIPAPRAQTARSEIISVVPLRKAS